MNFFNHWGIFPRQTFFSEVPETHSGPFTKIKVDLKFDKRNSHYCCTVGYPMFFHHISVGHKGMEMDGDRRSKVTQKQQVQWL